MEPSSSLSYLEPFYTDTQRRVLEVVPSITAPFSALGSFLVLWVLWKQRKTRVYKSTYHRLILGWSVIDFITSLAFVVFGAWAAELPDYAFLYDHEPRGNFRTCTVTGFFLNLSYGAVLYSSFLSFYFVLHIRWECRESMLARTFEPVVHAVSWVIPLGMGIYGIVKQVFNPMRVLPGWCWFDEYPWYCGTEDTVACVRGGSEEFGPFYYAVGFFSFILAGIAITFCMGLMVHKVYVTEKALKRYAGGQLSRFQATSNNNQNGNSHETTGHRTSLLRTRETGRQALLYIGAFFLSFVPIIMLVPVSSNRETLERNLVYSFVLALWTKTFFPLQGFFSAYIYLHKSFAALLKPGQPLSYLGKVQTRLFLPSCNNGTNQNNNIPIQHPPPTVPIEQVSNPIHHQNVASESVPTLDAQPGVEQGLAQQMTLSKVGDHNDDHRNVNTNVAADAPEM